MGGELATANAEERMQFAAGDQPPVTDADGRSPQRAQTRLLGEKPAAELVAIATSRLLAGIKDAVSTEAARGTPFLWLPVLIGIGALAYFALPVEPPAYALACGFVFGGFLTLLAAARPSLRYGLVAMLVVLSGLSLAKFETWRAGTAMLGSDITTRITGRVLSIEERAGGRFRLTVDIVDTQRPRLRYPPDRARLSARAIPPDLKAGDGVSGLVRLMAPSGPVRPQAYDFSFESYFAGIGSVGFFMRDPERVQSAPVQGILPVLSLQLQSLRESLSARLRERVGGAEGEIAAALITGMRGGIPHSYNEDLRRAGLAHVLAISGLHMALAAVTVMGSARLFFALFPGFSSRHPVRKYAASAALVVCFLYLFVSGAGVAAQRSFLMLAVMLLALLFDRAALTLRNLAIAGLVVLVVAPHEIVGPGFQMSFAATAALIAGYAVWNGWRQKRAARAMPVEKRLWKSVLRLLVVYVGGLALTSLIAGIATTLYGVWHFQRASPLALGANLVAMPVVTLVVMPSAVASIAAMPFNLDGIPLAAMGWGISTVMKIAHWFSERTPIDATGAIPLSATLILSAALVVGTLTTTRLRLSALPLLLTGLVLIGTRSLPDLFVSEDAKLVALRTEDGALAVNRSRPNAFSTENWLRAAGSAAVTKPVSHDLSNAGLVRSATGERFACNDVICAMRHSGGALIVQVKKSEHPPSVRLLDEICAMADLVIINDARVEQGCRRDKATMISARHLARWGSAEVRFRDDGAHGRYLAVDHAIGEPFRPWHAHRKYSRSARGLGPYRRKKKDDRKPAS
ncbi:ComEC/Rec2 family competence protein [Nitratireductor sp. GISD-1A_MAKvit]|uniref:ComEC/Rec2 family competence protein n=1 Tax=Nitratireductor sp. GISD-1A_MAKvit TaxID=3234198 RepID=UPI0034672353